MRRREVGPIGGVSLADGTGVRRVSDNALVPQAPAMPQAATDQPPSWLEELMRALQGGKG